MSSHKRARPGDDEGESHSTRTRDPEFWYEDGNIILIARHVEFRIYKGLLAQHSPVFADMFTFPQPGGVAPASAEPPLVHLTDSPESFRHILRACMPTTTSTCVGDD